jgi:hypothetical protein
VRTLAGVVACALSLAGCFGPEAREGLRCSADGACPPGQYCFPVAGGPQPGICASAPPPADAGATPDAGGLAFGAPEPVELLCGEAACQSPRDPSLTGNRKQIAFTVPTLNAVGDHDVYIAIRPTAFDPWLPANPAGAIDSLLVEEGGSLSDDGLRLFFTRDDQNTAGSPHGELLVSQRLADGDPFDSAAQVPGVVNTANGNERSAVRTGDASRLLFARALEVDLADHDVYVALESGGQWDTVARLDAVSLPGIDERSLAIVEGGDVNMLFVARGAEIIEARWSGGYVAGAEVVWEHDELMVADATFVSGVWVAPDGSEIWFGACGTTCGIYRAVR